MALRVREIYRKINELLEKEERFAVATVVKTEGSTPRKVGAKMLIMENGSTHGSIGGGKPETVIINEALKAIHDEKPRSISFRLDKGSNLEMICGGNVDIY